MTPKQGTTTITSSNRLKAAGAEGPLRWVTPVIALVPVFEVYATPVPGLTISKAALISLSAVAILSRHRINGHPSDAPLKFALCLVSISALALITASGEVSLDPTLARTFVIGTWALSIATLVPTSISIDRLTQWIIFIAIIATGYLFIQLAAWNFFGTLFPSIFDAPPILRPTSLELSDTQAQMLRISYAYYRPSSFFAEPQYYSDYTTLALIVALFKSNVRYRATLAITFSMGMLASTSTTALAIAALVWMAFIVSRINSSKIPLSALIACTVGIAGITYSVQNQLSGLTTSLEKLTNLETSARVGASFASLGSLTGLESVVGLGLGQESRLLGDQGSYINSVTAIILGTGLLGSIALVAYFFSLLKWSRSYRRLIVLVYILLSLSGSILYADRSVLWLALALSTPLAAFNQQTERGH